MINDICKKNIKRKSKAFTLIEILVVVAIIGILATVVLVFISSAKDKAKVASVKSSLNSIVSAGAMCRDGGGTIQNGNGGADICNDTGITDAKYPLISKVCGGNPGDTVFSVIDPPGPLDWEITLTCSGFNKCDGNINAYCDATGCHFPPGGTCR